MSRRRLDPNEKAPKISRDFGRAIVLLRGEKMSRETLAELAECHPSSIGAIERGESSPTLETIGRIATALNVKPSKLLKLAGY